MEQEETLRRRPIRARGSAWAAATARWLGRVGLRPNAISVLSTVCAAWTAGCFLLAPVAGAPWSAALLVIAAVFIQLRLLCNLFDGMVAVEGGFKTKSGEIYNELPDRISDVLALASAGYAASAFPWAPHLGWAAASLAVVVAYARALGGVAGASQQFCGPMAKQQRMAVLTAGCLAGAVEAVIGWPGYSLPAALAVIAAGSLITLVRRTRRIVRELESR